ncbi:MAG: hypothetical protein M1330_00870 [Armatimonadetes bacterium]|nr:hypothetical protein [Armatimonadota bacterium]
MAKLVQTLLLLVLVAATIYNWHSTQELKQQVAQLSQRLGRESAARRSDESLMIQVQNWLHQAEMAAQQGNYQQAQAFLQSTKSRIADLNQQMERGVSPVMRWAKQRINQIETTINSKGSPTR